MSNSNQSANAENAGAIARRAIEYALSGTLSVAAGAAYANAAVTYRQANPQSEYLRQAIDAYEYGASCLGTVKRELQQLKELQAAATGAALAKGAPPYTVDAAADMQIIEGARFLLAEQAAALTRSLDSLRYTILRGRNIMPVELVALAKLVDRFLDATDYLK